VCRCLTRWVTADSMDANDDSYWIQPVPVAETRPAGAEGGEVVMCTACADECGTLYFKERIMGNRGGPVTIPCWKLGDPRFNDSKNPLFAPHMSRNEDWRDMLTIDMFRDFFNYTRFHYGEEKDRCSECHNLKKKRDNLLSVCRASKKKKKKSKEKDALVKDLKDVKDKLEKLEVTGTNTEVSVGALLKNKPQVLQALQAVISLYLLFLAKEVLF